MEESNNLKRIITVRYEATYFHKNIKMIFCSTFHMKITILFNLSYTVDFHIQIYLNNKKWHKKNYFYQFCFLFRMS